MYSQNQLLFFWFLSKQPPKYAFLGFFGNLKPKKTYFGGFPDINEQKWKLILDVHKKFN